ncbi:MAG: hypothetical protein AAF909_07600 [Pseudomonadota bacterium]
MGTKFLIVMLTALGVLALAAAAHGPMAQQSAGPALLEESASEILAPILEATPLFRDAEPEGAPPVDTETPDAATP